MIIGEAPGYHENKEGRPFVGPSGQLTDEFLRRIGLNRSEVYITNVYKFQPPGNDIKRIGEVCNISQQHEILWSEINSIRPNCILALGNTPLQVLAGKNGIKNWRGSILSSVRGLPKIVPTFHPAYLLRSDSKGESPFWNRNVVELDFRRAKEQSAFSDFRRTIRTHTIIKNSAQLYNYIRTFNKGYCAVDIEASDCVPICIGLAFNSYNSISLPLLHKISYGDLTAMPTAELVDCWQQVLTLLNDPNTKVIGQNFKYDEQRLRAIGFNIANFYADTMLMAHTLQPELPKSLAFLTSIYTEEEYYKDEGKDFDPKHDKIDQLYIYNAKDASVTYQIWEVLDKELRDCGLSNFYYLYVHRLHNFYSNIESIGLKIDNSRQQDLISKYNTLQQQTIERLGELCQIFGSEPININSPKQVKNLLYNHAGFPERAGTDEETLVALLANHSKRNEQKELINVILNLRRINKTIGTYLEAKPDYDGRMRTSYKICGTETGRSSTQKLEPPVRPEKLCLAFQTMTKHGDIGSELREIFIADDGYVFAECDLSQAEARIVAILSDDNETLRLFDTTDIHTLTASWISGLPESGISTDLRFIGKTARHAGNYGMGKRRFMLDANAAAKRFNIPIQLSEWKAGQILTKFHAKTPKIRAVFHKEIEEKIASSRVLVNPFGRRRIFYERWGDDLLREAFAFIPQSTVVDHLRKAGLRLLKNDPRIKIVIEAHDAFTFLIPEQDVESCLRMILAEMRQPIDFSNCSLSRDKLIIPSDAKVGHNLKDLKKMKL